MENNKDVIGRLFVDQLSGKRGVVLNKNAEEVEDMQRVYAYPQPLEYSVVYQVRSKDVRPQHALWNGWHDCTEQRYKDCLLPSMVPYIIFEARKVYVPKSKETID